MKKILFFPLLLLCISMQLFAITGDGSYGSPYNGSLTANMNWSGTVYVNGDVTVNGFTLTISPGAIIVFLIPGSDLIITGTGVLTADGTNASMIRFTADSDNSGTYGGSGETRGHISFQNMTSGFSTPSLIDFCIVEFGKKNSSPFEDEARGGGINTTFTYVTISNSIIRNNYAGFGGGISVSSGAYPSISNCIISNNTAGATGGGLLLDGNPLSRIDNCIIMKNISKGGGGAGGVFVGDNSTDVRFYNCTIVSNISEIADRGDNIRLYNNSGTPKPRFYNTIVWGSNRSINTSGQNPASTDFNYCAIQGYTSGYTNCINLSSTNSDPLGPNFYNVAAGSEDYQIKFISRCRDLGISVDAPVKDYSGNNRIGLYDIGAYEVQYSRWNGATSNQWATASNWDGSVDPSSGTGDVIIPTGLSTYPTGATTQDFIIGIDKQMIIEQGARVTLDDLTNNGIIKLNHNASGFASLIINSYTRGTGATEEIQLYLAGGGTAQLEDYKWHYISTPVSTLATSVFTGVTFDLAQYIESRVSTSLLQGWVAYDGYEYSSGTTTGITFSSLTPGKGYDFWDNANNTFTFGGLFNTSDVTMGLSYTSIPSKHGFNLLGNPFSSGLDWDQIVHSTYFQFPSNTSTAAFFTRNNLQCTYNNGVGTPLGVTGIIPPMQGFFVKTYSAGNTITLPKAARTNSNIHSRYKGESVIPLVRLELSNDTASFDETVVRFDEAAKSDLDYDFDAIKMFITSTKNQIYTSVSGTDYTINGLPFPTAELVVPVVTNFVAEGNYKISATQLQGLEDFNVSLIDNTTGFIADLKTTPDLLLSSNTGRFTNRFTLIFSISTGIENPISSVDKFNIYTYDKLINIIPLKDEWSGKTVNINVLDITGRIAGSMDNVEFRTNIPVQIQAPVVKGMYLVEIRSGLNKYVGKVIIK